MKNGVKTNIAFERRFGSGAILARYYSVQFSPKKLDSLYQFKLWHPSHKGMCILVKENSAVLKHIRVGDTLNMQYIEPGLGHNEILMTKISHITKKGHKRSKDHFWVGLSVL
ncbi:MAG: hypothetical protein ACYS0I_12930 [Planctomycetota bacterium]